MARQIELLNAEIKRNLDDYVNFSRTVGVRNAGRFQIEAGATEEEELELHIRVEELKYLQTVAIELNDELARMDTNFGSK